MSPLVPTEHPHGQIHGHGQPKQLLLTNTCTAVLQPVQAGGRTFHALQLVKGLLSGHDERAQHALVLPQQHHVLDVCGRRAGILDGPGLHVLAAAQNDGVLGAPRQHDVPRHVAAGHPSCTARQSWINTNRVSLGLL